MTGGRVLADLATAIAGGAGMISDFAVMGGLREVAGPVAPAPVAWRTLSEIAAGGSRAQARITRAVNAARRQASAGIEARHGVIPGVAVADKKIEGVICIRPFCRLRTGLRFVRRPGCGDRGAGPDAGGAGRGDRGAAGRRGGAGGGGPGAATPAGPQQRQLLDGPVRR